MNTVPSCHFLEGNLGEFSHIPPLLFQLTYNALYRLPSIYNTADTVVICGANNPSCHPMTSTDYGVLVGFSVAVPILVGFGCLGKHSHTDNKYHDNIN